MQVHNPTSTEWSVIEQTWYCVRFQLIIMANENKMLRWLKSQTQGRWIRLGPYSWIFYFELKEDSTLFELTWVDIGEIEIEDFNWL